MKRYHVAAITLGTMVLGGALLGLLRAQPNPAALLAARNNKVVVSGLVTGPDYKPISGITIRAERDGKTVGGPVQSLADGSYELEVTQGDAVNVVFNHSAWEQDVLWRLSANRDHTINKVLSRREDLQSLLQALKLGNEQAEQVSKILAEKQRKQDELIQRLQREQEDELGQVLTEDQRTTFLKMLYGRGDRPSPPPGRP